MTTGGKLYTCNVIVLLWLGDGVHESSVLYEYNRDQRFFLHTASTLILKKTASNSNNSENNKTSVCLFLGEQTTYSHIAIDIIQYVQVHILS